MTTDSPQTPVQLPLPPALSDDERQFLHYNPNTSDIEQWVYGYAVNYARAALEAQKAAAPAKPSFNEWFCALPNGRQAVLREDKWMLANAAYEAGSAPAKVLVPDDLWLIASGNDATSSKLVIGWEALRRTWLDWHRFGVDHDNYDEQDRELLATLDDEDEWMRDGKGDRFQLSVHYEGDWVRVTRITDASALATHNGLTLGTDGDGEVDTRPPPAAKGLRFYREKNDGDPGCRDCADFGPICPNSGEPCGDVDGGYGGEGTA